MATGVQNTILPAQPSVNAVDFNTVMIVGIAPKGQAQTLVVCGSDTDDAQFGSCLTGFNIPRALRTHRTTGGGKVIVVNVFNESAHTREVDEKIVVSTQKTITSLNPTNAVVLKTADGTTTYILGTDYTIDDYGRIKFLVAISDSTLVRATYKTLDLTAVTENLASAPFTVSGAGAAGAQVSATVLTPSGTVTLGTATVPGSPTPSTTAAAIRATLIASGYTSTGSGASGSSIAPTGSGALANFNQLVLTASSPVATLVVGAGGTGYTSAPTVVFTGGGGSGAAATAVLTSGAVTSFTITNAGTGYITAPTISFTGGGGTGATATATIFTLPTFTASTINYTGGQSAGTAVSNADIVGTVTGSTRTGMQLIDSCGTILGIVPKILIIPGYNTMPAVATEMAAKALKYRMRYVLASTPGLTLAQALASRAVGGTLATFNTGDERAILLETLRSTYDPQSGTNTLDDPSASFAGYMSYSAAVKGPHVSISNTVNPAVTGAEISFLHEWEDLSDSCEANQLRVQGICTIYSERGKGWQEWGVYNASYPANGAVNKYINVVYTRDVIADRQTQFVKQYIDQNYTNASVTGILTGLNDDYTVLKSQGWIGTDSAVLYLAEKNPSGNVAAGKAVFTKKNYYYTPLGLIELQEDMLVQLPTVGS